MTVTWKDGEIAGKASCANISVSTNGHFRIEWLEYNECGYGTVGGAAKTVEEAKAMCEALVAIREKHQH